MTNDYNRHFPSCQPPIPTSLRK